MIARSRLILGPGLWLIVRRVKVIATSHARTPAVFWQASTAVFVFASVLRTLAQFLRLCAIHEQTQNKQVSLYRTGPVAARWKRGSIAAPGRAAVLSAEAEHLSAQELLVI